MSNLNSAPVLDDATSVVVEIVTEMPETAQADNPKPERTQKPRKERKITDSAEVLFEKINTTLAELAGYEKIKQRIWDAAKSAMDKPGDNRLVLVNELRGARNLVRKQTALKPVVDARDAAMNAWTNYVRAESAKGHDAQLAISREMWLDYAEADANHGEALRVSPRDLDQARDAIAKVIEVWKVLEERANNFVHASWCVECGAPVYEIKPKKGDPFIPRLCQTCFDKPVEEAPKPRKQQTQAPVKPQKTFEELKAEKRLRQQQIEEKRLRELDELQNLRPGQFHDGKAKKARDAAKEERKQGGDPDRAKGKSKKKK